jgi:hypothetical protein
MVAEGQVPPDELASHTLEEFGDGFLTIFRVSHHTLDGIGSETTQALPRQENPKAPVATRATDGTF